MPYTKTNWRNSQEPAINAANLNKMEQGIYDAVQTAEASVRNRGGVPGLYSGTDADKANVAGQSAGDLYYATDTGAIYRWSGSAWTLFIARNHTHSSPTQVTMLDDRSIAPASTQGFQPIKRSKTQARDYHRLLYSNADRLLRGLLYTKASPFTQSFTFSGDGTRRDFKIPRSAVNQKGFVRGGVTAAVNGSSAPGTFVKETQTFTFDTAPAAGTNNVVITATDAVPYQGMGVLGDTVEFLDHLPFVFATSYGSGGAWVQPKGNFYNQCPPTALLLPGYNANDDALLCDTLDNATFRSSYPFNHFPVSSPHINTPWIYRNYYTEPSYMLVQKDAGVQEPDRGRSLNRNGGLLYSRFTPTAAVPQVRFGIYLAKVTSTGTGSALSVGELVLCVVTIYLTTTAENYVQALSMSGVGAADLFRLSGGPVMEE